MEEIKIKLRINDRTNVAEILCKLTFALQAYGDKKKSKKAQDLSNDMDKVVGLLTGGIKNVKDIQWTQNL